MDDHAVARLVATTSLITFISGFGLGVYSLRGYLFTPSWREERRRNLHDPAESDESDVDEDSTILDHAPNWANGEDADRKQGLRVPTTTKEKKSTSASAEKSGGKKSGSGNGKKNKVEEVNDEEEEEESPQQNHIVDKGTGGANEECKLVLVVRTDLGMTKACYKTLSRAATKTPGAPAARILQRWERLGQAKIAVQTQSEDELLELMGRARSLGVTSEVIQDAGRTQIDPGSLTVLGVGPAPKSLVDQITGGLKLL
ncbi:Uu.00g066060.m01.CDS01 [Anthostomella pinea]|uniref:peptidyl-tRNA hydrolase n=1 Tax=Anthostomella pinea TaxID=933095 RepID=A0AAI8VTV8_9PEZI|nr:Uu.00g066060.m01.CDS01 [Anthostomella pinea]